MEKDGTVGAKKEARAQTRGGVQCINTGYESCASHVLAAALFIQSLATSSGFLEGRVSRYKRSRLYAAWRPLSGWLLPTAFPEALPQDIRLSTKSAFAYFLYTFTCTPFYLSIIEK